MTTNIGKSTLSHRIHGFIKNDPESSNKEYKDNQEDAIDLFIEELARVVKAAADKLEKERVALEQAAENYKPLIILHIERELDKKLKEKVTITRLDNGCGMNNVDVYLDPSNSTTKKNKNGNFCQGMFNSALSLHPKKQIVISRGSQNNTNSLIFYPEDMLKTVDEGLIQNKTFNEIDVELNQLWIDHESQYHPNPKRRIDWDEIITKNGVIINQEILKIKNGGRGTIQIQTWEKDCPLTSEIIKKYNNCLRYKRKNFDSTYVFNNKEFNIEKNCFVPNGYSNIEFDIKFLYVDKIFEKLFIKLPNKKIICCKKNETKMSDCEERIEFNQGIKFKLALVSSDIALKQKTDLNINYIGEMKRPIIETQSCLLGIGKVIYSTAYNNHHLFNCSENIHPRASFQIPSNLYKKFGVTGNKDEPNLSNPAIEIKRILANFVKPLYKYFIRTFGIEKKEIGNNGIKDDSVWDFDEMKNYILNKKSIVHKKTKVSKETKTHIKKKRKDKVTNIDNNVDTVIDTVVGTIISTVVTVGDTVTIVDDTVTTVDETIISTTIDDIVDTVVDTKKRKGISQLKKEELWISQFGKMLEVRCICEKKMTSFTANLGHIKAHINGGSEENENLYWICRQCNNNDTTSIHGMVKTKYGDGHDFYKKIINDFTKLKKKFD